MQRGLGKERQSPWKVGKERAQKKGGGGALSRDKTKVTSTADCERNEWGAVGWRSAPYFAGEFHPAQGAWPGGPEESDRAVRTSRLPVSFSAYLLCASASSS